MVDNLNYFITITPNNNFMIKKKLWLIVSLLLANTILFAQRYNLIIGTYNSPLSNGMYLYNFDTINGNATYVAQVPCSNPSYLTISNNKQYVYAVNENTIGYLSSYAIQVDSLKHINTVPTLGLHPCHVALSPNNKWAAVSNYSSGSCTLFAINNTGQLLPSIDTVQHTGMGVDTTRQKSPHAHSALFSANNKMLYVADLGVDKIYRYDLTNNILIPHQYPYITLPPGSGPRHFIFSQREKCLYVLTEMSGKIILYKNKKNTTFIPIQTISTLPLGDTTTKAGSADLHISPNGKYLYASNRGKYNNIAIFQINKQTGRLKLIGHQSTLGIAPRNISIHPSGNFLLAANQNSNEIIIFNINKLTGLLTPNGNKISIGKPVCIAWL